MEGRTGLQGKELYLCFCLKNIYGTHCTAMKIAMCNVQNFPFKVDRPGGHAEPEESLKLLPEADRKVALYYISLLIGFGK